MVLVLYFWYFFLIFADSRGTLIKMGPKTKQKIRAHLVEFFLIGLVMGVAEDLLAIYFATDATIGWEVFKVAFLVAFPFAVISELVVDFGVFRRMFREKER